MTIQGSKKPNINKNFFGDLFSESTRIVHENVGGSSPSRPHISSKGNAIMENEKSHANAIISPI